jgi:hypothetical protein
MSKLALHAADRRPPMNDAERYEELAEAAYDAMYRAAPSYSAKMGYEDAANFSKAIAAARKAGAQDEAARLTARLDHIRAVYNSQFRGL